MIEILPNIDTSDLDKEMFDEKGHLCILPSAAYQSFDPIKLRLWCHNNGIYCLPSMELIEWLKKEIEGHKTIEVGAGNGAVGRALGIPITDACLMDKKEIAKHYKMTGQPVTKYPSDIIRCDALAAVRSFKPDCIIGCWITHKYNPAEAWREGNKYGIDERILIKKVKKYIMVGNLHTHCDKPIFDSPHDKFSFPWLWSRSHDQSLNRIFVWNNGG